MKGVRMWKWIICKGMNVHYRASFVLGGGRVGMGKEREVIIFSLSLDNIERESWKVKRKEKRLRREGQKRKKTVNAASKFRIKTQKIPSFLSSTLLSLSPWNPQTVVGCQATAVLWKLCQRDGARKSMRGESGRPNQHDRSGCLSVTLHRGPALAALSSTGYTKNVGLRNVPRHVCTTQSSDRSSVEFVRIKFTIPSYKNPFKCRKTTWSTGARSTTWSS